MKVLITGGAGHIGSHVNRYLNEKNIATVIIDDLSDGHKEAVLAGDFIQGDFDNKELLDKVMTENKIDAVMHMAAFASVGESVGNPTQSSMRLIILVLRTVFCGKYNYVRIQ